MKNIAIFASGSGTNAENIIKFFNEHNDITIKLVLSNKKDAFVHKRAKKLGVRSVWFSREDFYSSDHVVDMLRKNQIDLVVLAGFLWLIPDNLIKEYSGKIINIHPALLPKYGGKGMYGMNVHKAVIENGEKESGISIHYVNEKYDEGEIIFQAKCEVNEKDSPEVLAKKIHELEYKYFPEVIKNLINSQF